MAEATQIPDQVRHMTSELVQPGHSQSKTVGFMVRNIGEYSEWPYFPPNRHVWRSTSIVILDLHVIW